MNEGRKELFMISTESAVRKKNTKNNPDIKTKISGYFPHSSIGT
jgi:hypothetical protein